MSQTLRVALWQGRPVPATGTATLLSELCKTASEAPHQAHVLVLPELFVGGYSTDASILATTAMTRDGAAMKALMAVVARFSLHVCFGFPERDGDAVYNSAAVVSSEGVLLRVYRKTHLFGKAERGAFRAGDRLGPLVDLPMPDGGAPVRTGVCICYDVEFPEVVREHVLGGAQLVLVPTANFFPFEHVNKQLVGARAIESQVPVAYCNWSEFTNEAGVHFCGLSSLHGSDGKAPVAFTASEVGMKVAEISMRGDGNDDMDDAYLRDRRPELYRLAGEGGSSSSSSSSTTIGFVEPAAGTMSYDALAATFLSHVQVDASAEWSRQTIVLDAHTVQVEGEVISVRRLSRKLLFIDLKEPPTTSSTTSTEGEGGGDKVAALQLQVVVNSRIIDGEGEGEGEGEGVPAASKKESKDVAQRGHVAVLGAVLRPGDRITIRGHPGRTRSRKATATVGPPGFSVFATSVVVDALCALTDDSSAAGAAAGAAGAAAGAGAEKKKEQQNDMGHERLVALLGDVKHRRIDAKTAGRLLNLPGRMVQTLIAALRYPIEIRERARQRSMDRAAALARQRKLLSDSSSDQKQQQQQQQQQQQLERGVLPARAERVARMRSLVASRRRGLVVVIECPGNPGNTAAIMRTCDAFGVTELLLVAPRFELSEHASTLHLSSVSASSWVNHTVFESTAACNAYLRRTYPGIRCLCTAVHSDKSVSLHDADLSGSGASGAGADTGTGAPVAVWVGNEARGLSDEAHALCETHVYVPMLGMVESLNQSVCAAVVLWEVVRQRTASGVSQPLPAATQEKLLESLLSKREEEMAWGAAEGR